MGKEPTKLVFRGKEYQSFSECYKDNLDIARISIPTFVKRVREGIPIEDALKNPKGRTLVTRLGSIPCMCTFLCLRGYYYISCGIYDILIPSYLSVIDAFSKALELVAIPNKKAQTVMTAFRD